MPSRWSVPFHPGGETMLVGAVGSKSYPGTQENQYVPIGVVPVFVNVSEYW